MAEENRRNITSLEGILRFCTENTKTEDTTQPSSFQPMADEDREWLAKALTGMQGTDPIKRVMELMATVSQSLFEVTDELEAAVEELVDWCEHIDIACDFVKIGGRELVQKMLASPDGGVRWRGAELLAAVCQNNPFCQSAFLATDALGVLSALIDNTSEDEQVRVKAQLALSCVVRSNPDAQKQLVQSGGLSLLLRAMESDIDKLRMKAAFLLLELVPENKDQLCDMGMVEQLASMLGGEHNAFHEHLMSALLLLVEGHARAQADARRPQIGLAALLHERIGFLEGREECVEELDYAKRLRGCLFEGPGATDELGER